MKATTFAALAVATVVVAGGAYWASQQRGAVVADPWEKRALYPGLIDRINDVTALRIESQADGTLTMTKAEAGWGLAEKYGYAVDFDKVRQTLVQLTALETIEPKTQKAENYPDLHVEAVDASESTNSARVTVEAGGQTLADLMVGRTRPKDVGGGVFVRKAAEDQAWLATGSYQPQRKAIQWLDRSVVDIDSRRVRLVEVRHADGESLQVAKPDIASEDMAYASPVPEGLQPKPAHEMNNMGNVPDFLIFEDVRPVAEVDWSADPVVSTFTTYGGLQLTLTAVRQDGVVWVKGTAAAVAPDPRAADFMAANKGQDSAQGRLADELKDSAAVAAEAAELERHLAPWAYQLTDYKSGKVTIRPDGLLQPASIGGRG